MDGLAQEEMIEGACYREQCVDPASQPAAEVPVT
jgi:hypothetical protein